MTTATARITKITNDFKARLAQHEAEAEQALNAAHARTLEAIQPILDKLYDQILKEMETLDEGETIPRAWIYERLRLESIQLLITHNVDNYAALSLQQTRMQQHLGANLGQVSAREQLQASVPGGVSWTFGIPSTKAIESLVGATQKGSPLADLFNQWGKEAADGASQALVNGVTLGWNPRRIAPQVEQALDIPRWRALTISRTEMLRSYRGAALETYRANSDVVSEWLWVAALNPRTCAACIVMHGTKHPLDEEFSSHPNCRCSPTPVTKPWESILGPLGIDTGDIPDTRVAIQSGPDWFNEQPEEVKQQILGAAKYAAYNDGKFTLEDIVGHSHSDDWGHSIYEKSLKDLVKK